MWAYTLDGKLRAERARAWPPDLWADGDYLVLFGESHLVVLDRGTLAVKAHLRGELGDASHAFPGRARPFTTRRRLHRRHTARRVGPDRGVTMSDDFRICGTALHHMELLDAGDGDMAKGRLVLAEKRLAEEEARLGPEDPRLEQAVWAVASALATLERHDAAEPLVARHGARAENPQDEALAGRLYEQALGDLWRGEHRRAETLLDWALGIYASSAGGRTTCRAWWPRAPMC